MTLQELYLEIDGSYEQATRVLRIDKLIDKHIRRFPNNTIFDDLNKAISTMDGTALFESAHAIKGVCSNLGLLTCANQASLITEEYRSGNSRKMSDEEVKKIGNEIIEYFNRVSKLIKKYESENNI